MLACTALLNVMALAVQTQSRFEQGRVTEVLAGSVEIEGINPPTWI